MKTSSIAYKVRKKDEKRRRKKEKGGRKNCGIFELAGLESGMLFEIHIEAVRWYVRRNYHPPGVRRQVSWSGQHGRAYARPTGYHSAVYCLT